MPNQAKTVWIFCLVALFIGVLRFFMRGWCVALGLPQMLGSLLASITIVLLVGLVVIFVREALAPKGRYFRAAGWFVLLAAWCQALVIAGILITARTGATTYYEEMMGNHRALPPVKHAIAHIIGFFVEAAFGLIVGVAIYAVAKYGRRSNPAVLA